MLTLIYSVLENGIWVPGRFPIGEVFDTQWGPRRVVKHVWETIKPEPEPVTTWGERV